MLPSGPRIAMPKHLKIALDFLGEKEISGSKHNAKILRFLKATHLPESYLKDETAWCSAFVCFCLEESGIRSTRSAAAHSYMNYGEEINTPVPGCIMVFRRKDLRNANAAHVAFYYQDTAGDPSSWDVLGGNQGNMVSIKPYLRSKLVTMRMPTQKDYIRKS